MRTDEIERIKHPVSVYDVEQKKLVMVFDSMSSCAIYVFDKYNRPVSRYLKTKQRLHKNRFGVTICFRHANPSQIELLGENKFVILDARFSRLGIEKVASEFTGVNRKIDRNKSRTT